MTANDVIKIALNEVGYREGANNDTKYGIWYGLNNNPWCVMFLTWVFDKAGDTMHEIFPKAAHCDAVRDYAKLNDAWVSPSSIKYISAGDIIIWDYNGDGSGDHIGMVTFADDNKYTTVEGNCGDMVQLVIRDKDRTDNILGIYIPDYETMTTVELYDADKASLYPIIRYGDGMNNPSEYVKIVQALLALNGYDCGTIDGEYGNLTRSAVYRFKLSVGMEETSDIDADTWYHLIKNA